MEQYRKLVQTILDDGNKKIDRTKIGTISYFGTQSRYLVDPNNFPLLTLKRTWWKGIVHELLWMIKGDTNIKYLVDNGVNIWNEWPFVAFQKSSDYQNETLTEFVYKIKNDHQFAKKHGNLGPVYGAQWRNFKGVDQLQEAIKLIKKTPNSRRIIVSAWNPPEIKKMLLPPCHAFFQFYVRDGVLSLQLYQRSADLFLGVPFNIASYSLLLLLVANITKLKPGEFIHTIGDAHLYLNHLDGVQKMLNNSFLPLPKIRFKKDFKTIDEINFEDIELVDYHPHGLISAPVAV